MFTVENKFLLSSYEEINLDPKNFLHCATISELNDEVEDYINEHMWMPDTTPQCTLVECIGTRYWDDNFFNEWQKLKNLPSEL